MKKFIYLTVCLTVLGISQAKAQAAKVALQHNGLVTLYNADKLQEALDASVDGDTIYLNEGTFKSSNNITISKKVSLIGAGENTVIDNIVYITVSGTLTGRILDALTISGAFYVKGGSTNGLKIRKCKFLSHVYLNQSSCTIENGIIDRCFFIGEWLELSSNIKSLNFVNSKVYRVSGGSSYVSNVNFINCNVYAIGSSYGYSNAFATFINSIVNNYNTTSSYFSNCVISQSVIAVNEQNCQIATTGLNYSTLETNNNFNLLGTDGTQIGIYGGTTPFTLVPSVPTVTSYNLNVNTTTKRLNVNISVESK